MTWIATDYIAAMSGKQYADETEKKRRMLITTLYIADIALNTIRAG